MKKKILDKKILIKEFEKKGVGGQKFGHFFVTHTHTHRQNLPIIYRYLIDFENGDDWWELGQLDHDHWQGWEHCSSQLRPSKHSSSIIFATIIIIIKITTIITIKITIIIINDDLRIDDVAVLNGVGQTQSGNTLLVNNLQIIWSWNTLIMIMMINNLLWWGLTYSWRAWYDWWSDCILVKATTSTLVWPLFIKKSIKFL